MDFEKEVVKAGLSLDTKGNIAAIGKSFCFYPRDAQVQQYVGRVITGSVVGIIQTTTNNIVLIANVSGAVPGKNIALRYFPERCDEVKNKLVPEPGWHIEASDIWGSAPAEYWKGTLKFI